MLNILVVEDDPVIATELVETLNHMGHKSRWAGDPEQMMLDASVDLVLLDLGLGRRDGFEVLEQLGAADVSPPVIIASGSDQRIIESACRLAAARGLHVVGTLVKPFTRKRISDMLDRFAAAGKIEGVEQPDDADLLEPTYLFQSKHALSDGEIVGYEALLRLPGVRDIEAYFAGLDRDRSLALTLAAAEAAATLQRGLEKGGRSLTVAFNCPPEIFGEPDLLCALKALVARLGVDPAMLAIEFTEQQGRTAAVDLGSMASRYALAGFQVHLDDFGSGAASLEQMLHLPLREVKIDRKVFRSLSQEGKGLLFEIVAHCRAHGIVSTIEGIETEQEYMIAQQSGADFGQGFFWSRPVAVDRLAIDRLAMGASL